MKREAVEQLMDRKKAQVLKVLLFFPEETYLQEISQKSQVSLSSTFRILQELTTTGLVHRRKWKTSTLYRCPATEQVAFLRELWEEPLDGALEFAKKMQHHSQISHILVHGQQKRNKANVLVIGEQLDQVPLEEACKELKSRGIEITYLTLTKEQYRQLVNMGLYAGEKKIVYGPATLL